MNAVYADDRPETDSCECGTAGCAVNHTASPAGTGCDRTSTVTHKVTFEVPARERIVEVQAAVTPVLDRHTIVERVGGSGQVLTLTVTFGNQAEVEPLTQAAYFAAMHITPVEMKVS